MNYYKNSDAVAKIQQLMKLKLYGTTYQSNVKTKCEALLEKIRGRQRVCSYGGGVDLLGAETNSNAYEQREYDYTDQSIRFEGKTTNPTEKLKKLGTEEKGARYTNYHKVNRDGKGKKKKEPFWYGKQSGLKGAIKDLFGEHILDDFDMSHRPDFFVLSKNGSNVDIRTVETRYIRPKRSIACAEDQIAKGVYHKYFYQELAEYLQKKTGLNVTVKYLMMLSKRFADAERGKKYLEKHGVAYKIGSCKPSLRDLGLRK